MTALAALDALAREVLRLFPAGAATSPALSHTMDELRAKLTAVDGAPTDIGPLLDMLDELLECHLRGLGWPANMR